MRPFLGKPRLFGNNCPTLSVAHGCPLKNDQQLGGGWCTAGVSTFEAPEWRNASEEPGIGKGKSVGNLVCAMVLLGDVICTIM